MIHHEIDIDDQPTMPLPVVTSRRAPAKPRRVRPRRDESPTPSLLDEFVLLGCGIIFGTFFGTLIGLAWCAW